ncbi:hypothetical protein GCM10010170_056710 [Dactylosporangium salmoneum]|uniref:Uncharacterized protein n=1 Tax=Dactylosporangium salmoneum TaxID=53361 RepID=A0ABN3GUJ7_9ACTN
MSAFQPLESANAPWTNTIVGRTGALWALAEAEAVVAPSDIRARAAVPAAAVNVTRLHLALSRFLVDMRVPFL